LVYDNRQVDNLVIRHDQIYQINIFIKEVNRINITNLINGGYIRSVSLITISK